MPDHCLERWQSQEPNLAKMDVGKTLEQVLGLAGNVFGNIRDLGEVAIGSFDIRNRLDFYHRKGICRKTDAFSENPTKGRRSWH